MSENWGQLTVQSQGNVVRTVSLVPGRLSIGRTPDNGLALDSPLVSSRHAELEVGGGAAVLTDLGSSQGTFVAGRRLLPNQPTPLTDGATIQVGLFIVTYTVPRTAEAAVPTGPAPLPTEPEPDLVSLAAPPPAAPPRPTFEAPRTPGPESFYLDLLPAIFQDQAFLGRYLLIFQTLWEPLEWRQDHLSMYFDPRTAPAGFLSWLAGWLGVAENRHWPEERRRRFVAEAMELYRWRGTTSGLRRMIEVCADLSPAISEEAPFVFKVVLPAKDRAHKSFVEDLIERHKPAHAGYVLEFGKAGKEVRA